MSKPPKKMMVIAHYADKESGDPRCTVAQISEGISKKTGKPFSITDTDRRETIESDYPVGTILYASTTFSAQDVEPSRGMKINNKP